MSTIEFPIIYIPNPIAGRPLFNSQIFVGVPDEDPTQPANQKQLRVMQEDGTLVNVAQPFILSAGGVPIYQGSIVRLDVVGDYAMTILDSGGGQIYHFDNVLEGTGLSGLFDGPDPTLANSAAAIIVGTSTPDVSPHVASGPTTTQAKADGTTAAPYFINPLGGGLRTANKAVTGTEQILIESDKVSDPNALTVSRNILITDANMWLYRDAAGAITLTIPQDLFLPGTPNQYAEFIIDNSDEAFSDNVVVAGGGTVVLIGSTTASPGNVIFVKQRSPNVYRLSASAAAASVSTDDVVNVSSVISGGASSTTALNSLQSQITALPVVPVVLRNTKTSTQTKTSDIALAIDDDLKIASLVVGTVYAVELEVAGLFTDGGLNFYLGTDNGTPTEFVTYSWSSSEASLITEDVGMTITLEPTAANAIDISPQVAARTVGISIKGYLTLPAGATTIGLFWAQDTSNANGSSITGGNIRVSNIG